MRTINIWNKYNISWQKIGLISLLLFSLFSSFAQEKKTVANTRGVNNLPNYDDKTLHYGFSIGINSARFRLVPSGVFLATDSIISVIPRNSGGFSLGFIVNYRLGDHFDLRLLPTVSFYERKVEYTFIKRGLVDQISEATF